ncbi:7407_t:CDS:2, partial [Ambispora leptoticha]
PDQETHYQPDGRITPKGTYFVFNQLIEPSSDLNPRKTSALVLESPSFDFMPQIVSVSHVVNVNLPHEVGTSN